MNVCRFLLVIVLFAAVTGCKSTSKIVSEPTPNNTKESTPFKNTTTVVKKKENDIGFERVPVTSSQAKSVTSQYDTISLSKFRLQQHTLYKTELTNEILFKTDSSVSYNISSEDVTAIAKLFNTGELGKNLYIVGHTDSRGAESYNVRLSLRRAMSVATKLTNAGVDVNVIKLVPAGEYQPAAPNKPKSYHQNRRVDILSANSRALISAFIREQDCTGIDTACKKTQLSVLSLENDPIAGIVIKANRYDSVTVASPDMNDLRQLSSDLTKIGTAQVDIRDQKMSERERLGPGEAEVRDTFLMDVIIRDPLIFRKIIKEVLRFDAKYIVE